MPSGQEVTRLLMEWNAGNKAALDLLVPLVYDEMRRLAQSYLRDERAAATLQPTALVHEAYARLVAQELPDWESRSHFFRCGGAPDAPGAGRSRAPEQERKTRRRRAQSAVRRGAQLRA